MVRYAQKHLRVGHAALPGENNPLLGQRQTLLPQAGIEHAPVALGHAQVTQDHSIARRQERGAGVPAIARRRHHRAVPLEEPGQRGPGFAHRGEAPTGSARAQYGRKHGLPASQKRDGRQHMLCLCQRCHAKGGALPHKTGESGLVMRGHLPSTRAKIVPAGRESDDCYVIHRVCPQT